MKNQVNIGVIGIGMVAEKHIQCIKEDGRAVVAWLCDKNKEVLNIKLKEHAINKGTDDYQELLNDPSVDAVIISTPPHTHAKILLDCIKAGKHVLMEKPLCASKEEMDTILHEAAHHPEVVVLECSCRHARLQPKFEFIKEMISSGKLGEVYYIHHNAVQRQNRNGIEYHPSAKWFLNKKLAIAGPLVDWGVYDLSFHLGILGDVPELKSVQAFSINGLDQVAHGADVFDVEEHGVAYMEFDNGLKYFYERSTNAHNETDNITRVYGTKGGLRLSYPSWDSNEIEYFYVDENGTGKAVSEKLTVDMSSHVRDEAALTKHFIDILTQNEKPLMPLPLAAKHLGIIFEILEAVAK